MLLNPTSMPAKQLVFANETFEVWKDEVTDHHSLFTTVGFQPGDIICTFAASAVLQAPSYFTVQVNKHEHICLEPSFLQYTNHSCFPNILFDTTHFTIVCLRTIKAGDELCYFYPATEWEMAQPFQCNCGYRYCLGYIGGASYLPKEAIATYKFSDFIYRELQGKYPG
jgi:hypothetical protein